MLKVASYNIRKGIGLDRVRRPDRILDVLAEIDADVIALQEADRRFGDRVAALSESMLLGTPWRPVELNRRDHSIGWHGNAILVKRHVEIRGCAHIELPTLEPRGAVLADLAIDGAPFCAIGMHLDLSGLRRRQQARTICQAVARRGRGHAILMGDLNEWAPHGGCLREFGAHFAIAPTPPSFHTRRPVARLDRIMTSGTLRVTACGVHHSALARRASDHLPIWARIEAS